MLREENSKRRQHEDVVATCRLTQRGVGFAEIGIFRVIGCPNYPEHPGCTSLQKK